MVKETRDWPTARAKLGEENGRLRAALRLLLDQVDYTAGACSMTELVGAVLPQAVLQRAKEALKP